MPTTSPASEQTNKDKVSDKTNFFFKVFFLDFFFFFWIDDVAMYDWMMQQMNCEGLFSVFSSGGIQFCEKDFFVWGTDTIFFGVYFWIRSLTQM